MNKQRLLNMAYDLNIKLAYSDIEGEVVFKQFEDESLGIAFTHFSDYYKEGCAFLDIFDWYKTVDAEQLFTAIKEVMTGERLVTDETDSHLPN
jgi:(2Fe-2S) ferredoxin